MKMLLRFARLLAYTVLGLALAIHGAFVLLQNVPGLPAWPGELTRFLPFYWLLMLLLAALLGTLLLRPVFGVLALCNLALFVFGTLDFHWNFASKPPTEGTHLRLLTYNMKALDAWHTQGGYEGIERGVQRYAPDIVAVQDAQWWLTRDTEWTNTPITVAHPVFGLPYAVAFGEFVVASRLPLTECKVGSLAFSTLASPYPQCSSAQYLQCQVHVGTKVVQLVAPHLARPRNGLLAVRQHFLNGLQQWQLHVERRQAEAESLRVELGSLQRPLVVMGDFNTPEQSPVFATLKRAGLRDAFSEAGRGWGYTHGHGLSHGIDLYRIDHILLSPELVLQNAETGHINESEHNPVIADVYLPP